MVNKSSTRIALGGLSASLCLVVMLTTALIPFATYTLPALAGILLIPIVLELNAKTAWCCYCAVSLLSLLIVPDRETALMFIAFFGYYPILKFKLDKIKLAVPRWITKFFIFNAAICSAYFLIIYIFGLSYLLDEFAGGFGILLIIVANICFPIYELALRNMYLFYVYRVRKMIFKV